MIARAAGTGMAPRDDAVDLYIAALLDASSRPDMAYDASVPDATDDRVLATVAGSGEPPDCVADGAIGYYLCNVSGLQLAVPKKAVERIGPVPELDATASASPPWLLGIVDRDGRVCHAVDLARIIAPGGAAHSAPEHAIFLAGSDWLLAVGSIDAEPVLAPEHVRWRENPVSRPWLAGMASEPLCAVLDVAGLSRLLSRELQRDAT